MRLSSNDELVSYLVSRGALGSSAVIEAFKKVDRSLFVPRQFKAQAYYDEALPIGLGQTISQPSTVAFMLELLQPEKDHKILEIGSGSGYVAALLGAITYKYGRVIAIERHQELVDISRRALKKFNIRQVKLIRAHGSKGYFKQAPYDRIIVSAAMPYMPRDMISQLTSNGKMVAPVGGEVQDVVLIEMKQDKIVTKVYPGFKFVPLVTDY